MEFKTADESALVAPLSQPALGKNDVEIRLGGTGKVLLINLSDKSARILVPQTKTYYEGKTATFRASYEYYFYAIVRPIDVDDARTQWMVKPGAAGETCRNMGSEKIGGRDTVKYDLSCYGEICHLWFDRELHALIKRETVWNSTELRNIREIPQQPSLFEVPSSYVVEKLGGVIRNSEPN